MFPTSRKMTSTAILFLSFLTGCLSQNVAEMGILQLQYYSKSGAVASDILSNSISVTRDFLDAHFADYFDNTVGNGYFSHISLTVVDFDVLNDYAVSIDLKGSAFFQRTPVPGSSFLSTVLYDAFKGDSRMDYVSQLQTADDDFFQLLSYIVIGLDGNVIANEDVAAKSLGRESADALTNGGVEGLAIPEIVIIAGASAAGFALVIISAVLFSFSRDGSKKLTSKGRDLVIDTAITSKESGNTEVNTGSPKWISPLCSAESQDSSVFTYNPRTTTNLKTESKPNPPAFQKNRQDIRMALDAKAWSKASDQQSVGPDQIQNSIFAIDDDKKESCTELSFIEEGDNEDETPRKPATSTKKKEAGGGNFGNIFSLDETMAVNDASLPYSKVSAKKSIKQRFLNDSWYSEDDVGSQFSDGSDVITDLNNLSRQVDKHRGRY